MTHPFTSGGFVWTGFDYRGEPSPYKWPCVNSHFGILDTCGFPKDLYYYYKAWWTDEPVLHLAPHWTWPGREGQSILVRCFGNSDEVELFLNDTSLGKKPMPFCGYLDWKVAYAPGVLSACGTAKGRRVATARVETVGPPARIRLLPDRGSINADGADLSIVTVEVVDAMNRVVPVADNAIRFSVEGGKILGVGNGDPSSHEADKAGERRVFNGLAQVIVQSTRRAGPIVLRAAAQGLESAEVKIRARQAQPPPSVP